ncbi:carbonic anhydrase [Pholiota molesta]|nr:carbonic anhydrase [Pholiota molesta]
MHASSFVFLTLAAISSVFAHPIHHAELRIVGRAQSAKFIRSEAAAVTNATGFEVLSGGNKAFRQNIANTDPKLLQTLADEGQTPPFMFIGCSDSRVSEGTVFNAKPGTLFTQRNIANQFQSGDANAQSVLSYAVAELGVNHIIVMGHYGCGGVAASIASPPVNQIDAANGAVQSWIEPIREIFRSSNRSEIVDLRAKIEGQTLIEEPDIKEPGFRALVEENIKVGVRRIATSSVISNHYAALAALGSSGEKARRASHHADGALADVFIHGWVYDIENGEVHDLGVSVGPPGKAIPAAPFEAVAKSAAESVDAHGSSESAPTSSSSATATATSTASAESKLGESTGATTVAASTTTEVVPASTISGTSSNAGVHVVGLKMNPA